MISFKQATIRRGGKLLLNNASVNLHRGQKIGLTGNNGVGKSTLFAVILGKHSIDEGQFDCPSDWQIDHMAQEVQASEQTALDYVLSGDTEWYELNTKLANQAELSPDEIAQLHERFDIIDGYRTPAIAAQILSGLGFNETEHSQTVASFSGGWRMRLNLARTLIARADVLLLDEPTNHLDLDAILWLEEWLVAYEGLVLLISHDQLFLDAVVGNILHIEQQTLTLYTGNYSQFVQIREERLAEAQHNYEKQQATKAHLQSFIDRFRAKATKAKQAQSRMKQLERMQELSPVLSDTPFDFHFFEPLALPSPLVRLDKATIGYDKPLLNNVNLEITKDTRLGILGANGAGKSTLIKALVGQLPLLSGQLFMADKVVLGYFNQHQMDTLDLTATPMLLLRRLAGITPDDKLRAFLGSFDFRGDKVDEKIALFSGGERARLTLAMIVWQRPNLLVLDEPTNHLDLQMRQALTLALQNFAGALVLVSHDRELILSVCDTLMLVGQGQAISFDGDMSDYAEHLRQARKQREKAQSIDNQSPKTIDQTNPNARTPNAPSSNKPPNKPLSKETLRKLNAQHRKQLAPLKKEIAKHETHLTQLLTQLSKIDERLSDPALYDDDNKAVLLKWLEEQTSLSQQLKQAEDSLMTAMVELETLEQDLYADNGEG